MARPETTEETASFYSRVAARYAEEGPPYFAHARRRLVEFAQVRPVMLSWTWGRDAVPFCWPRHAGLQFTHVLSSFAVFFFTDLPAVLRNVRQLLRPNGVAGFAFSRSPDPRWRWDQQLLRDSGALAGLPEPRGYPRIREPGILGGLLEASGFRDVLELEEATDIWYASPEAWWASLWTHGSRRPLERMAPELLARVKTEAARRAGELAEQEGVLERMQLVYVLARTGESVCG